MTPSLFPIAIHEAAHGVVLAASGIEVTAIELVSVFDAFTVTRLPSDDEDWTPTEAAACVVGALAGPLAHLRVTNGAAAADIWEGSAGDLAFARRALARLDPRERDSRFRGGPARAAQRLLKQRSVWTAVVVVAGILLRQRRLTGHDVLMAVAVGRSYDDR